MYHRILFIMIAVTVTIAGTLERDTRRIAQGAKAVKFINRQMGILCDSTGMTFSGTLRFSRGSANYSSTYDSAGHEVYRVKSHSSQFSRSRASITRHYNGEGLIDTVLTCKGAAEQNYELMEHRSKKVINCYDSQNRIIGDSTVETTDTLKRNGPTDTVINSVITMKTVSEYFYADSSTKYPSKRVTQSVPDAPAPYERITNYAVMKNDDRLSLVAVHSYSAETDSLYTSCGMTVSEFGKHDTLISKYEKLTGKLLYKNSVIYSGDGLLLEETGTEYETSRYWDRKSTFQYEDLVPIVSAEKKRSASLMSITDRGIKIEGLPKGKEALLEIYSVKGQKLESTEITNGSAVIEADNLAQGVYLAKLSVESKVLSTLKFTK